MQNDSRLILTAAPFGTITAADNTATTGKFAGFLVTKTTSISEILDKNDTDITDEIIKGGAGIVQPGAYHTPRTTAHFIKSITHDGTGEITLIHANAIY